MSVAAVTNRPTVLPVAADGIPDALVRDARWVNWRLEPKAKKPGEWTKVPYRADDPSTGASSTNSKTWATFGAAFMAYQSDPSIDGVGWNLEGSGVVGIDLDGVTDDAGRIAYPWVREIVDAFPGYWERSPSGRGLRGLGRGVLPPGGRKGKYQGCTVEMYDGGRYLTITGHTIRTVDGDELPELQAYVEAVHARLLPGGGAGSAELVDTRLTGRVADVPPAGLDVLVRTFGDRFGEAFGRLWSGDLSDHTDEDGEVDESGADWRMARELIYQTRGDAELTELLMRASALYREKWDEPRPITKDTVTVRTTYLGLTIGNALGRWKIRRERVSDLTLVPDAKVANETLEQAVARLQRELAQERAVVAAQQTIIRAQRAELERERELRARDRRLMLAEQRLDRCSKFNAGQKAAIKAVARIAPALANSLGKDDPIITREMVAEVYGAKEETAGGHLKVFDLEGSPVPRVLKPYGAKALTHYKLETRDPIEIIDAMAALGEQLDKRPAPRQRVRCRTCPEGTGTVVNIICEGCGQLLDERHVAAPKDEPSPNAGKNPPLGPGSPLTVDVVTLRREKPPVAGRPDGLDEVTLVRRAREAVEVRTGAPDPSKSPGHPMRESHEGESVGRIKVEPKVWRCSCGSFERGPRGDGALVCDGCSEVVGTVRDAAVRQGGGGP